MANFKNLEAVLNLVASTGDRVIIVSESHEPFVIMGLADYQALLAKIEPKRLAGPVSLEKINRDIALARTEAIDPNIATDYSLDQFKVDIPTPNVNRPNIEPIAEEEEKYYIEPVD
ncbi:MAG: hypothetical protein WC465_01575 [Patescibacteria group bacterium]